jgi:type I restriction enzyme M protein
MTAIERDNPSLKGVLPKDYARPGLDKQRLGQIINLVSDIALGSAADRAKDTLGRVYDPCCGSGGMFVQSEKFIEAHSGRIGDLFIYGQESNYTTWRLAKDEPRLSFTGRL